MIILNTDLLAASLITHQDRCYAGLPVHHSHLSVPIYLNICDRCRERDSHLLSQLGELEHALLVQLDPLLQDSQKNLTQHINLCGSPSNFKFGFRTNMTLTSDLLYRHQNQHYFTSKLVFSRVGSTTLRRVLFLISLSWISSAFKLSCLW